ncbi:MAG: hypothetical protein MUF39_03505, partial [Cyclobacteriaceae bacterium]|nr:hypothetical protein [Cyclobacteriaceae bacterium]
MSQTNPIPNKPVPQKSSNKSAIIIALLSVIVLVQSVKIFLDYKDKVEVKQQLATTEEDLASTMQRLNEVNAEL